MSDPVVLVSSDTHIGPLLKDQLRAYCPAPHLEAFDETVAQQQQAAEMMKMFTKGGGPDLELFTRNWQTEGHHDAHARLRDMDFDGITAEVIFHGSQNAEPIPFQTLGSFFGTGDFDPELTAVGLHIYNQWLADYCSIEPERHVGLAHLPMWDVDAAVAELRWAREAGLRAVNFPAPRATVAEYNDRVWDPFWSACEDLDMTLTTHAGAQPGGPFTGAESTALLSLESGGWPARRGMIRMLLGGVFERHPRLKLVLTEQPGDWWTWTLNEIDSAYLATYGQLKDQVPRRPSEYCRENVFIGASFLARYEAEAAVRDGYTDRVMWGSDYPHMEGTYQYPDGGDFDGSEPQTHLSLRFTFADIPADDVRSMVGANAIQVYGLDGDALAKVAARINAPTIDQLREPVAAGALPASRGKLAYREFGPWA